MPKTHNLGTDSIPRLLFSLAVPAIISQLVNMLYNLVDRMYIGHLPDAGAHAITGLGICFPVLILVSSFSLLFGMGGAPLAAIEMGKGNQQKAQSIMGNCAACLLISAITLMLVQVLWGREILFLFGASPQTIDYALQYLNIYAFGTLFVQISLGLNMFITTQGFAKYSMTTVILGAVCNIILDPIFIYGLDMGIGGAALATVISQGLAAAWVLRFLRGDKTKLRLTKKSLALQPSIILPIMALGISPFIMQSTESLLSVCFNTSLREYGGDLAVGAMTIIICVMNLVYLPILGINQGAQPIISFNYGAGRNDRVREVLKLQISICVAFSIFTCILVELFPQFFISIFSKDAQLMEITVWTMRVYSIGLFSQGIQCSCQQGFVALGFAKKSLLLAILRKIILLIPLIYILPYFFENKVFAVFLAEPIADILAASITGFVFLKMARKYLRVNKTEIAKDLRQAC